MQLEFAFIADCQPNVSSLIRRDLKEAVLHDSTVLFNQQATELAARMLTGQSHMKAMSLRVILVSRSL